MALRVAAGQAARFFGTSIVQRAPRTPGVWVRYHPGGILPKNAGPGGHVEAESLRGRTFEIRGVPRGRWFYSVWGCKRVAREIFKGPIDQVPLAQRPSQHHSVWDFSHLARP